MSASVLGLPGESAEAYVDEQGSDDAGLGGELASVFAGVLEPVAPPQLTLVPIGAFRGDGPGAPHSGVQGSGSGSDSGSGSAGSGSASPKHKPTDQPRAHTSAIRTHGELMTRARALAQVRVAEVASSPPRAPRGTFEQGGATGGPGVRPLAPTPLQLAATLSTHLLQSAEVSSPATAPSSGAAAPPTALEQAPAPAPAPVAPTRPSSTIPAAVSGLTGASVLRVVSQGANAKAAVVRLDHPTLGRIELELGIDRDGVAVRIITHSDAAMHALRASEAALRVSLDAHGFRLRALQVAMREGRGRRQRARTRVRRKRPLDMEA